MPLAGRMCEVLTGTASKSQGLSMRQSASPQLIGGLLTARRLRWLGHVLLLGDPPGEYPHQALFSFMHGAGNGPCCAVWQLTTRALRGSWRSLLYRPTHPRATLVPFSLPPNVTPLGSSMRQSAETLPFQAVRSACGPGARPN